MNNEISTLTRDERIGETPTETPKVPPYLEQVLVVTVSPAHLRAYDFNAGDERLSDLEDAVRRARLRAIERGVRQQVRSSSPALQGGQPLWLIQDI